MLPRSTWFSTVVMGSLLAACAASPSATPPAASSNSTSAATPLVIDVAAIDPCDVLELQALSAEVGVTLPPGMPLPDSGGYARCQYDAPEASTAVSVLVSRQPAVAGTGEDRVGQLPLDGLAEELHGVGEAAWFDYCPPCADDGSTTLTVVEPPLEFTIALTLPAPDEVRRISLERLARGVIDRLGL